MKSLEELIAIREKVKNTVALENGTDEMRVVVGLATCGIAAGARPVLRALVDGVKEAGLSDRVSVKQSGCIGICQYEPIVEVHQPGKEKVTYVKMTPEKALEVIEKHLKGGKPIYEYTIGKAVDPDVVIEEGAHVKTLAETDLFKKQLRVALRNCGVIDPENIEEYFAVDGYLALGKVLKEMTPDDVIKVILDSGLRGRGGGGFPTGRKWRFAADQPAGQKYVVCNADEGDPGAFMDRSVLEGDPHAVLEAMAIAGYAIGANEGWIYVRAEYPVAVQRLQIAIKQAKEYGVLGENIFGTGFNFDINIRLGAGAFVCGEETALLTSIEGKRGNPRPRPPFPAIKGLWGRPTIINNVETYANVAQIILKGSEWFASMGTEKSKGTKVFALGGKITNTGLVEIPMGTTLREIVEEIGGGVPNGKKFKAAQTGGPSGGCIPASLIDTPIDYDNLTAIGSMMGSGGLIVMDEDTCMVDLAKFFLEFTVDESCGKCSPCRIGTKRMLEILNRITAGNGTLKDLDELEEIAATLKSNSLCALGQTAANPVLSTIKHFRNEYIAHIVDKKCPAKVCKNLMQYVIEKDKCVGCGMCAKACPANAIARTNYVAPGKKLAAMEIDSSKCVKCGACMATCKFGAIYKD